MNANYTGSQILQRRKALGLTQKELAQMLHVTDKAVSKWERGVNFPDLGLMESLAAALETTPAVLLGLEDADRNEIVSSMVQISNGQLEEAQKHLRIAGWLSLLAVGLLMVVYVTFSQQRTQAYQILGWLMPGLAIGGFYLLFRYGAIRKWNTVDWLAFYGAVIPVILFNAGYLFMDHGFPDAVEYSCILISAISLQLLFYRIMQAHWAKALPVIGLVLYNLWYLAGGGVMVIGLVCTVACFGVWLVLRKLDKSAKPLPVLKIAAISAVGLVLFGFLFYESLVKAYVNLRHDHLISYCETLLEENAASTQYGPWKVSVYPEDGMVEFHTGGAGLGSDTSYEGFYYSSGDAHIPFSGMDFPVDVYEDTGWWHDGTDNYGSTYRFRKYFYWFEAQF